jgi:hypothetical protein
VTERAEHHPHLWGGRAEGRAGLVLPIYGEVARRAAGGLVLPIYGEVAQRAGGAAM